MSEAPMPVPRLAARSRSAAVLGRGHAAAVLATLGSLAVLLAWGAIAPSSGGSIRRPAELAVALAGESATSSDYPVDVSFSGTFTDAYMIPASREIYTHKPFYSTTTFGFTESRVITVRFDGSAMTTSNGTPRVTVSGGSTTVNQAGAAPQVNCKWRPAPGAGSSIIVNSGDPGAVHAIHLSVPPPAVVGVGVCSEQSPAPWDFWNPDSSGKYDPGARLQAFDSAAVTSLALDQLHKAPVRQIYTVDFTEHDRSGGTDHVRASGTVTVSLAGTVAPSPFAFPGPELDNLGKAAIQLGAGGGEFVPVPDETWPDPGTLIDQVCIVPDPKNPTGPCPSAAELASGSLAVAPAPAADSSGMLKLTLTARGKAALAAGKPVLVLLRVTFQPAAGRAVTATRTVTIPA